MNQATAFTMPTRESSNTRTIVARDTGESFAPSPRLRPPAALSWHGRRYRERRARGVCPSCGGERTAGRVQCQPCIEARRTVPLRRTGRSQQVSAVRYRERAARFAAAGRCFDCRQQLPSVRGLLPRCDGCRERFNARRRKGAAS